MTVAAEPFADRFEAGKQLAEEVVEAGDAKRRGVMGWGLSPAAGAVRKLKPAKLVIAVPVAAAEACDMMREVANDVVCALTPEHFAAVGMWYEDFSQTSDEEVRELLQRASRGRETHHGVVQSK